MPGVNERYVRLKETVHRFWTRFAQLNLALIDQALVSGVNFLTGILLARFLGIKEFGVFTLAWMAVLLANSFQTAFISNPMMSVAPKLSKDEETVYFGSVLLQQLAFSLATFALLVIGIMVSEYFFPLWEAKALMLPLACAMLTSQTHDFFRRYFYTRGKVPIVLKNDIVCYGGRMAFLIVLFYMGMSSTSNVIWVLSASFLAGSLIGYSQMETTQWPSPATFKRHCLRHWRLSRWLAASALLQWMSGNLFVIVAGATLGATAVGALKAAQSIMGVAHILLFGLGNIAIVKASKALGKGGVVAMKTYLKKLSFLVVLSTLFFAIIVSVAPEFLLATLFGGEYAPYYWVLRGYAVAYVIMAMNLPLSIGLKSLEQTLPVFLSFALAMLFSVIASSPFVGWFGIYGAVAGVILVAVIRSIVLFFGFNSAVRTYTPLKTDKKIAGSPG